MRGAAGWGAAGRLAGQAPRNRSRSVRNITSAGRQRGGRATARAQIFLGFASRLAVLVSVYLVLARERRGRARFLTYASPTCCYRNLVSNLATFLHHLRIQIVSNPAVSRRRYYTCAASARQNLISPLSRRGRQGVYSAGSSPLTQRGAAHRAARDAIYSVFAQRALRMAAVAPLHSRSFCPFWREMFALSLEPNDAGRGLDEPLASLLLHFCIAANPLRVHRRLAACGWTLSARERAARQAPGRNAWAPFKSRGQSSARSPPVRHAAAGEGRHCSRRARKESLSGSAACRKCSRGARAGRACVCGEPW